MDNKTKLKELVKNWLVDEFKIIMVDIDDMKEKRVEELITDFQNEEYITKIATLFRDLVGRKNFE